MKTVLFIFRSYNTEEIERQARQIYIGNPPLVQTEEVLRKEFSHYGDIIGYVQYEFRGSLNVHIEYANADSVEKALKMNLAALEGHRIRVSPVSIKFIRRRRNILLVMLDDPNVTEDELFEKYCKNTELLCVNKVFPHAYLVFPDSEIKAKALLRYRADGLDVLEIGKIDMMHHSHILQYQNVFPTFKLTISVSNLSDTTKESDLRALFSKYGDGEIVGQIIIKPYGYKQATAVLKFKSEAIGKK